MRTGRESRDDTAVALPNHLTPKASVSSDVYANAQGVNKTLSNFYVVLGTVPRHMTPPCVHSSTSSIFRFRHSDRITHHCGWAFSVHISNENGLSQEVLEERAQVEKWFDCPSKDLAPLHSVKNGILHNAFSTSPKRGCRFEEKCSYAHRQVEEQPSKRFKKNGDKSAVAMLKIIHQLGCVFQDMEPPKSTTILRNSSNMLKPIRCVRFTKAVVRHANIRDRNPPLGMLCPGDPQQCNPSSHLRKVGVCLHQI